MTSTIPACKDCKHFQESPDEIFSTCALYTYEEVDYFNGKVSEYNCLVLAMRDSENACGRDGKDFEEREVVEEEEDTSFWGWLKGIFTYGGITNNFKEQIHKIKLEMEENK